LGIYASHVLEHLSLEDFHKALRNTKKILKSNGIFRLVVPDLESAAREYLRRIDLGDPEASTVFLEETCLGRRKRARHLPGFLHEWLRTSDHLWMWDTLSMKHALEQHGFRYVRRCAFGDCDDPMFAMVEEEGRFERATALEARG